MAQKKLKPVPNKISISLIGYVILTFLGYSIIGLPLAILPIFINKILGYNAIISGLVISLQYFTTFIMRGYAGTIVDKKGPKPAVLKSMICFALSGVLLFVAYECRFAPVLSLSVLIITRLVTGCGEGMIGASPINWAMLAVGDQHTGTAISFNGIASYGGLAIGAPLGVLLEKYIGIEGVAIVIICVAITGFIIAKRKKAYKNTIQENRQSFMKVLKKVSSYGICLAIGGLGFGAISTFMTLYYDYMHWTNGALCLTVFGATFILTRIVFNNAIKKYGGIKVSIASFIVETLGLAIIAFAGDVWLTLVGAGITGIGFSLVFPALGVEAVKLVSASNKGSALAAYGLFIDISLGITGPLVGVVAEHWGMGKIYPFSMGIVFIGLLLSLLLKYNTRENNEQKDSILED
ncbi:MAG: MFS transporter [Dysgonomonas sp.]